jgi:hypothetical protein
MTIKLGLGEYYLGLKYIIRNQLLVGSVVIGAEFGRESYSLIPVTTIRQRVGTLDAKSNSRTKLNRLVCRILF